ACPHIPRGSGSAAAYCPPSRALLAQVLDGASILRQIVQRIVPVDMMGGQKCLELVTGVKVEKAPQLGFAERPFLVGADGIFFEDMEGNIRSRGLPYLLGDIIRNM